MNVPMFENLTHLIMGKHLEGETFLPAEGVMGHPRVLTQNRRPYQTRDGHICMVVYDDRQWKTFLKIVGEPNRFESDARFSSQINRIQNIDFVYGFLAENLLKRNTSDWMEVFKKNDIAAGPMNSL